MGDVVWRASVRSHDSTHAVMRRALSGDGEEPAQVRPSTCTVLRLELAVIAFWNGEKGE